MIEIRANSTGKTPPWSGMLGEVKSLAGTQTTGLPLMPFEEWSEVRLVSPAGIVTLEGPGLEVLRQLEAIVDRLRHQLPSLNPSGPTLHNPPPPLPPEPPAEQLELVTRVDGATGEVVTGHLIGEDASGALLQTDDDPARFVKAEQKAPKKQSEATGERIQKRRGRPKKEPSTVFEAEPVWVPTEPRKSSPGEEPPAPLGIELDPSNPDGDDDPETHQPAI